MKMLKNDLNYIEILKIYKQAIDESHIAVWKWDFKKNKFFVSDALEKITQYSIESFNNLYEVVCKIAIHKDKENIIDDINFFSQGIIPSYKTEFRIITKSNHLKWVSLKGNSIKDEKGEVVSIVGVIIDISKEKDIKRVFKEKMYYDFLTKLPNRDLFFIDIKNILNRAIISNQRGAIIFIDLDNFKSINDTLDHNYGDLLLKVFSQLLNICVSDYGKLYRLGGDEFVGLISNFNSMDNLREICNTILGYCKKPFKLNEKHLYITTSIGISTFPQDGYNVNELLKFAELAMYASKSKGRNTYTFFEQTLSESYSRRIMIENELKESIKNDEFYIVYQPQIDVLENKIVAFESLLRWKNKRLGFVPPSEFIPIAEENGMILEIFDWVLDKVCKKIREFKEKKYEFNNIAINVSPIEIKQTNFKDKIINVCKEHKIPLNLLEIEITERTLIELNSEKISDLHELIREDINISIDDFGTGYSSLSYLTVLPINALKIDKSFIDNIKDEKNRAVIQCILDLSKTLRYKVIAEGVEIKEQLGMLTDLGCNIFQGYYFSRPVGEFEVEEMLKGI